MSELHYNRPHCQIYYLSDLKCVHLNWNGYANSENFREACNFSLELLAENKADKMIADNTKAKIVKQEDQTWMNEDWFLRAFGLGFRTSAVVVAKDIFRDLSVKKIVNELDKNLFTVQFFATLEDAKQWITEVEKAKQTAA